MTTSSKPDLATNKAAYVRTMFARIVPRYDLINRLMTAGLDRGWRRLAVRMAAPAGALALDLATGTGDMAVELAAQGCRAAVGADFCFEMVRAALAKPAVQSCGTRLGFIAADAVQLPFAGDTFDCLVNGFLLRNLADLSVSLREFRRVLKPGGRLVCLDLTHPPAALAPLFWPFFRLLVPALGGVVSGDLNAYAYLSGSLRNYPDGPALAALIGAAGFQRVAWRRLGLGAVALHSAFK